MITDIVPGSPSSDLILNKNRNKIRKNSHKLRRKIKNKSLHESANSIDTNLSIGTLESNQIISHNSLSSSAKRKFSDEETFGVTDTELFQVGEAADAVIDAQEQNISFLNKSYDQPKFENNAKVTNSKTIIMDILNDFNESHEEIHSPPPVLLKSDYIKTYSRKVSQKLCARKLAYSPTSSRSESIALSDHDFRNDRALTDFDTDSSESAFNGNEDSFIDMNETSKIGENLSQLSFLLSESPETNCDNKNYIKDHIEIIALNRNSLNYNKSAEPFNGFEDADKCAINIIDIDKQSSCKHTLIQRFDSIIISFDKLYYSSLKDEIEVDKMENNKNHDIRKSQSMSWVGEKNDNIDINKCKFNTNYLSETNKNNVHTFKVNKKLVENIPVDLIAPSSLPISAEGPKAAQNIFNDYNAVITISNTFVQDEEITEFNNNNIEESYASVQDEEITELDNNNIVVPKDILKKEHNETLKYNKEFKTNVSNLEVGFSAASGKRLAVSKEALKSAQNIFNDCNEEIAKSYASVQDEEITECDNNNLVVPKDILKKEHNETLKYIKEFRTNASNLEVGFSAASGKRLAVSKEALKSAQNIFNDCNEEIAKSYVSVQDEEITELDNNNIVVPKDTLKKEQNKASKYIKEFKTNASNLEVGFSATSGKRLAVSKELLKSAQNIFNDCNKEIAKSYASVQDEEITECDNNHIVVPKDTLKKEQNKALKYINESTTNATILEVGFSSASGKHLKVSKEALKAAQNIFNDCNEEIAKSYTSVQDEEITNLDNHNIVVPKETLNKEQNKASKYIKESTTNANILEVGFSAASGKRLAVSKEALKAAQNIFNNCNEEITKSYAFDQDEEITECDNNNLVVPKDILKKEHNETLKYIKEFRTNASNLEVGFSAASGKRLAVSKEALKSAQNIFNDCNEEIAKSYVSVQDEEITELDNNNIVVPKDTLKKEQNKASKYIKEFKTNASNLEVGFSAASGKRLAVSKELLKSAQNIFNDCNKEIAKSYASVQDEEITECDNNHIVVPKDTLKKEQNKALKYINESTTNATILEVGFSAASGKHLKVSKEALKAAQNIFNDCNEEISKSYASVQDEEITECDNNNIVVPKDILKKEHNETLKYIKEFRTNASNLEVGFSAASGKRLAVSKEALKAAQNIFNDCNEEIAKSYTSVQDEEITNLDNHNIVVPKATLNKEQNKASKYIKESRNNATILEVGFNAASGKRLAASKEVLKAAQNIFNDCNEEITKSNVLFPDKQKFNFDKNFNVPLETLIEGNKVVLNYIDGEPKSNQVKMFPDSMEVTKITQKVLNNHNGTQLENIVTGQSVNLNSVSCKNLSISDEALKVAQKLFDEIDNDDYFLSNISHMDSTRKLFDSPIIMPYTNKNKFIVSMASTSTPKVIHDKYYTPKNKTIEISLSQEISASTHALLEDEFFSTSTDWENLISPSRVVTPIKLKQQCPFSNYNTMDIDSDYETPKKRVNNDKTVPVAKRQKSLIYSCIENITPLVKKERLNAEAEQCLFIKNKIKELKRQSPGIVFLNKNLANRQKLSDYVENSKPMNYSFDELINYGLRKNTIETTVENALAFKFNLYDFYSLEICNNNTKGVELHDNIILLIDENSHASIKQIKNCFLAAPGVDPSIVPKGWVENSYKWIVSKLASMERSFPQYFSGKALTPQNVILQMKYRYDLEIDNAKRSVLRKIIERDDVSCKRMILFVSKIKNKMLDYSLELSDGWYSINTEIDTPLRNFIKSGKIKVGTKLVIQGAELLNNEQGCSPLEMTDDVKLKIFANSTRRVKWDTKLGYCKNPLNLPISLNSIIDKGGLIGSVSVFILRMYPMMYLEKTKGEKGSILRSEKVEKRINSLNENMNLNNIEIIYSQVRKEVVDKYNKTKIKKKKLKKLKVSDITEASQLYELLENSNDPENIEQDMSATQKELVKTYQSKIEANLASECEELVKERLKLVNQKRSVCPLLKIRIVDARVPKYSMILSIWRPDENILKTLKENIFVSLFNISASGSHCNEIQLSAGKRTIYKVEDKTKFTTHVHLCRKFTPISDITNNFSPNFNEFDTIGIVVCISDSTSKQFQSIYIADANFNILCINFWAGLKEYAYDDIVQPKSILGILNLKWRSNMSVAFATEFTQITEKSKTYQFSEIMEDLTIKLAAKDMEKYIFECNEKINELKARKLSKTSNKQLADNSKENVQNAMQYVQNTTPHRERKYGNVSTPKNAMNLSNSILETPKEFSPGVGQPVMSIQNRIELLQKYGEPPELSPLVAKSSQSLKRKYTVPRRI